MDNLKNLLKKFDNISGAPGAEENVAKELVSALKGCCDEHFADRMGNTYFIKKGTSDKKILLSAHMDEIGFIISYILDSGQIKLLPVGYHDNRAVFNQRVVFTTRTGKQIYGVCGSTPFHYLGEEDAKKIIPIEELSVDIGATSADEARGMGLEIGDYATFATEGDFINGTDLYVGKSVDNRAGLAVLASVLQDLKGKKIEPTICIVGTCQEEVGMRAGNLIVNNFEPDIMLAVDLTLTDDNIPEGKYNSVRTGGGFAIKFYDWDGELGMTGNNVSRKMTDTLIKVAEKNKMPFQREVMTGGGTDAWSASMAGKGVLCGGLCIPSKYIHTSISAVDIKDLESLKAYIHALLGDEEFLKI